MAADEIGTVHDPNVSSGHGWATICSEEDETEERGEGNSRNTTVRGRRMRQG